MRNPSALLHDLQTGKLSRRELMARTMASGLGMAGMGMLLQSCASVLDTGSTMKWATWGNPGEMKRFKEFTQAFNEEHDANFRLIPIVSSVNYSSKILIELNGGVAPDLFYAGDNHIGKFVANDTIVELTPYLNGPDSKSRPEEFIDGLWSAARTLSGKIYGVPVDCNPFILWYNKTVLEEAGIKMMPQELYDKGMWTPESFQEILTQVQAKGKYGYILDKSPLQYWSWCTSNGGQIYADNGYGEFIAHEDSKTVEIMQWLSDNVKQKRITFSGTLPKGQGTDLAFMSNQVAFVCAGRWFLPTFKQTEGLRFDIIPFPSHTGKIQPAGIPMAYMVINKKTKDLDTAFEFFTNFVSKEGQKFRLQGGGNAVPSVRGVENLVLEGNLPEHAHFFTEARDVGYGLPPSEMATPALTDDVATELDPIWFKGQNVQTLLAKAAAMANPRIQKSKEYIQ